MLCCRLEGSHFSYRLLSAKAPSSISMPTSNDDRPNTRKAIHASAMITNHRQTYQKGCHWTFVNVSTPISTCIALKTIEMMPKINSRGP